MSNDVDYTIGIPRFLSFIELGYLLDAAKISDSQLKLKIETASEEKKRDVTGNVNATRQSLLRSVFISSFAVLEQHMDEIVLMEQSRANIAISPNDLKDRGIKRSLTYSSKVLGRNIDTTTKHWADLFRLQKIRNHLVHYGADFSNTTEHEKRWQQFKQIKYVTLRPMICFSIEQIEEILDLFMTCVDEFIGE